MIFSPVLFYDVDKRSFTYREEHNYWIGVKGTRSIKGEKTLQFVHIIMYR